MVEQKQHDFLAALFFQPNLTMDELIASGINTSNSSLQDKEYYKDIPAIQEAFQDKEGKLDENKFTNYYNSVQQMFNEAENRSWEQAMLNSYEYDKLDPLAPIGAKRRDVSPALIDIANPERRSWGISSLTKASAPNASVREVGQQNNVFNSETGKFEDWTPNDLGLFKGITAPTLVLATYDQDTEEVVDGRVIKHKKGDFKLNEYGETYYETLGKRSAAGKEVLHVSDILTTDGSNWNKYDFFDSDGLDKSAGKIIMHTAARVAPMLIPVVGQWYGGLTMGLELAKLIPSLEQGIGGILGFNTSEYAPLLGLKNYAQRWGQTSSDYSKSNFFSLENIGNIIASSGTQLAQQRLIGQLPIKIKEIMGRPITENTVKWGQQLALAYMAGTSSMETFDEFKNAGASDRMAGLGMIASMLAMNSLMQNDYYKDVIFKGSPLDRSKYRSVLKESADEVAKSFSKGVASVEASEQAAANWVKKLSNTIVKKVSSVNPDGWFMAAGSEALEETSEEMAMDVVRALFEGASALGLGSPIQFEWSLKDMLSRYGASFIGGGIGGMTFKAHNEIQNLWSNKDKINNKAAQDLDKEAMQKMITLIRNGKGEALKSELNKLHKKGALGSTVLSDTQYDLVKDDKGTHIVYKQAEVGHSQNDAIYNQLNSFIDRIEKIMTEEGLYLSDDAISNDVFGEMKISELKKKENYSYIFSTWNQLTDDIIRIKSKMEEMLSLEGDQPKTKADLDAHIAAVEKNKEYQDLKALLESKRQERDDIISGKRNDEFYGHLGFVVNPIYPEAFIEDYGWENWVKVHYHKEAKNLTDLEKEEAEKRYATFQNKEEKNKTIPAWNSAYALMQKFSPVLANMASNAGKANNAYSSVSATKAAIQTITEKIDAYKSQNPDASIDNDQVLQTLQEQLNILQADLDVINENSYTNLNSDGFANIAFDSVVAKPEYTQEDSKMLHRISSDYINHLRNLVSQGKTLDLANAEWHTVAGIISDLIKFRAHEVGVPTVAQLVDDDLGSSTVVALTEFLNTFPTMSQKEAYEAYQQLPLAAKQSLDSTIVEYDGLPVLWMYSFNANDTEVTFGEWLKQVSDLSSEVQESPMFKLLDELTSSNTSISVSEQVKQQFKEFLKHPSTTVFEINDPNQLQDFKNIRAALKQIAAIVEMSEPGQFIDRLNHFRNESGKDMLPVVDPDQAESLKTHIAGVIDKLNTLIQWHEHNSGAKLKAHYEIGCHMRPLFTSLLLSGPYKEAFGQKFDINLDEIRDAIEWPELPVTKETFGDYDLAATKFETEIYKAIRNKKYSAEHVATEIVNMFMVDGKLPAEFVSMRSTDFSTATETITPYDACIYLCSVVAHPAINAANQYKKAISRDEYKLAPVFSHEWGAKLAYSLSKNIGFFNVFNHLINTCAKENSSKSDDPYQKQRIVLPNTVTLLGGAGTGKTAGGAFTFLGMLENPTCIAVAPTKRLVDKLASNLKIQGNAWDKAEFLTLIHGEPCHEIINSDRVQKLEDGSFAYVPEENPTFTQSIFSATDTNKVLVIDEFTLFTVEEQDLIAKWAKENDVLVIFMGDRNQTTITSKILQDGEIKDTGLDWTSTWAICAPKFMAAFRPTTVAQRENQQQMEFDLDQILSPYYSSLADAKTIEEKLRNHFSTPKALRYYDYQNGTFTGIKIHENPVYAKSFVENTEINPKNIGILVDKTTYDQWKDYKKRGITVINISEVDTPQGQEFDYCIVDIDPNKKKQLGYQHLQDFYTWTTRATLGTIVVDKTGTYNVFYSTIEDKNSGTMLQLQEKQINDFKEWRANSFNNFPESIELIPWGEVNQAVPTYIEEAIQVPNMQVPDSVPVNPFEEEEVELPGVINEPISIEEQEAVEESAQDTIETKEQTSDNPTPVIPSALPRQPKSPALPPKKDRMVFSYKKSWAFYKSNILQKTEGFALKGSNENIPAICAMTSMWFLRGHNNDHQRNYVDTIKSSLKVEDAQTIQVLEQFERAKSHTYVTKRIGDYYVLCVYPDKNENSWLPISALKIKDWTIAPPLGIYNGKLSVGDKDFTLRYDPNKRNTKLLSTWLDNMKTHKPFMIGGQIAPVVLMTFVDDKIKLQEAIKKEDPTFDILDDPKWRTKMNSAAGKDIHGKLTPDMQKLWWRVVNSGKSFIIMSSDPYINLDQDRVKQALNFDGNSVYDFDGSVQLVGVNAQVRNGDPDIPANMRALMLDYVKHKTGTLPNLPWNSEEELLKSIYNENPKIFNYILMSILGNKASLIIQGNVNAEIKFDAKTQQLLLNNKPLQSTQIDNKAPWAIRYNDNGYRVSTRNILKAISEYYLKGDILPALIENGGKFSQGLYLEVSADRNQSLSTTNGIALAKALPAQAKWYTDADVIYDNDLIINFDDVVENKELGNINAQLMSFGIPTISTIDELGNTLQKQNEKNKTTTKSGTWTEYSYDEGSGIISRSIKTDALQVLKNLLYDVGITNVVDIAPYFRTSNNASLKSGPFVVSLGNESKLIIFYDGKEVNLMLNSQVQYWNLLNACYNQRNTSIPTSIMNYVSKVLFFNEVSVQEANAYYDAMQLALQNGDTSLININNLVIDYLQNQLDNDEC